jgi:hypothetical protein
MKLRAMLIQALSSCLLAISVIWRIREPYRLKQLNNLQPRKTWTFSRRQLRQPIRCSRASAISQGNCTARLNRLSRSNQSQLNRGKNCLRDCRNHRRAAAADVGDLFISYVSLLQFAIISYNIEYKRFKVTNAIAELDGD